MKSNSNIQGYCNQYAKAADLGMFEGLKMEKKLPFAINCKHDVVLTVAFDCFFN